MMGGSAPDLVRRVRPGAGERLCQVSSAGTGLAQWTVAATIVMLPLPFKEGRITDDFAWIFRKLVPQRSSETAMPAQCNFSVTGNFLRASAVRMG